jgi:hypothetical protein
MYACQSMIRKSDDNSIKWTNFGGIRIDTFHATTWNCEPRFSFVHPQKDLGSTLKAFPLISKLDLELLDIHLQTGERLGSYQVLQVLRILTAVRFADPVSVFNRLALSDAIYLLERQLLSSQEQDKASRASSFGINIQQPFRLATFLYVDMVLREMHSINIRGLVHRLTETLQTVLEDDHFQELAGTSHSNVLLWVFFIGGVASQDSGEGRFFVEGLRHICNARQFRSKIEFEEALDKVGPGMQSFSQRSAELWTEMLLL